jgi:beta-glucanase (GH16 family)
MIRSYRHIITTLWALGALAFSCPAVRSDVVDSTPQSLLINGGFGKHPGGKVSSWTPLSVETREAIGSENGQPYLRLTCANISSKCGIQQKIVIRPEWSRILVRGFIRVNHLTPDQKYGAAVGLAWRIKGADELNSVPVSHWNSTTDGWVEINQILDPPAGADQLIITPQISGATGTTDFRQLRVDALVQTFDDEFQGTTLDTTKWSPSDTDHLLYTPGIEYLSPDHVIVGNGQVTFHGDKVAHNGYQWQSGEIRSVGKFQQKFGYWEFKMKIPTCMGAWPAAYLLKYDDSWPPEIDVQEDTGNEIATIHQTNHYADDYGRHQMSTVNFPASELDLTTWHTYAICWEQGELAWYIDNVYRGSTGEPDADVSNVPMYIRINLGIGDWGGDPNGGTWPQDLLLKYARVYQLNNLPLPLYPEPSVETTLPNGTVTLSALSCNPMTDATATWTLAEGPAAASIENPHLLTTKAVLTKPGMYRFNIKVSKGLSMASRDLLVYVNPSIERQ